MNRSTLYRLGLAIWLTTISAFVCHEATADQQSMVTTSIGRGFITADFDSLTAPTTGTDRAIVFTDSVATFGAQAYGLVMRVDLADGTTGEMFAVLEAKFMGVWHQVIATSGVVVNPATLPVTVGGFWSAAQSYMKGENLTDEGIGATGQGKTSTHSSASRIPSNDNWNLPLFAADYLRISINSDGGGNTDQEFSGSVKLVPLR